jgi:hypothetical protein
MLASEQARRKSEVARKASRTAVLTVLGLRDALPGRFLAF